MFKGIGRGERGKWMQRGREADENSAGCERKVPWDGKVGGWRWADLPGEADDSCQKPLACWWVEQTPCHTLEWICDLSLPPGLSLH